MRNIYCINPTNPDTLHVLSFVQPLREACVRCIGEGLLASGSHIRECPTCEGSGGVWTCDEATLVATINFLMTTYPDTYRGPSMRLGYLVGQQPYEPPPEVTP